MQSVVRVHDLVKRHASLGPPSLLRTPFEKLLERGAHLFLRAEFDKIRTLRVEPGKKDSRFAYIWSRTKSVKQVFSGPSLTLAIQHVEPQTRSKYWSDTSTSASWPSVGAVLVPKNTARLRFNSGWVHSGNRCTPSTWGDVRTGWQPTDSRRIKTQTCPIFCGQGGMKGA